MRHHLLRIRIALSLAFTISSLYLGTARSGELLQPEVIDIYFTAEWCEESQPSVTLNKIHSLHRYDGHACRSHRLH